jgi:hypothetical protein
MSVVNNPIAPASGTLVATLSTSRIACLMQNMNMNTPSTSKLNCPKEDDTANKVKSSMVSSSSSSSLANQENLSSSNNRIDPRVRFIIEFGAGAAGGAVSRTV